MNQCRPLRSFIAWPLMLLTLSACSTPQPKVILPSPEAMAASAAAEAEKEKSKNPYFLICKAKRSRFQFDWSAASPNRNVDLIDQNSVRYEFKPADHPAGGRGEMLKVGECSWAEQPMSNSNNKKEKAQFIYRSLSDEQTQAFYKMRTGRIFKLPVRQGRDGMEVLPGAEITVLR